MSSDAAGPLTVRIVHQMARTGGTLICRCLGSMRNVVLLSEIHPLGVRMFDPLHQAHEWHGLLTAEDFARLRTGPPGFADAIVLIAERCADRGLTLVLRDWSHLDFTGIPFTRPVYRSQLVEALRGRLQLLRFSTVRHPLDQWLSLAQKPVYRRRLGIAAFLEGAAAFAESAARTGFVRYEDFTVDSDAALRAICAALDVEFDPSYRDRWAQYERITGDVLPGRAGSDISTLPRRPVSEAEARVIEENPQFPRILQTLGYDPDGVARSSRT